MYPSSRCFPVGCMQQLVSAVFRALSFSVLLAASLPLHAVAISGAEGLVVTVSANGSYEIATPSPVWKFAGTVGFPLRNLTSQNGWDAVGGAYSEISFDFFSYAPRHASIRSYSAS